MIVSTFWHPVSSPPAHAFCESEALIVMSVRAPSPLVYIAPRAPHDGAWFALQPQVKSTNARFRLGLILAPSVMVTGEFSL
ncbi:MAG: hypothetical protein ACLQVI_25755 [Polyangiaceae bacterium]